jgi:thioester reductase-like protein
MEILLTGATGLLGGELLVTLCARDEVARVHCLVRGKGERSGIERLRAAFSLHGDAFPSAKVVPMSADLHDAALSQQLAREPLENVELVVHAAANTSFLSQSALAVEAANVHGLERMLSWARELPRLRTFLHVSTAAICGAEAAHRVVDEDESPNENVSHLVAYTASKARAERRLRRFLAEEQVLVARPSIILGDTRGKAPRSPVVLWAMAAINRLRLVPVDAFARLDAIGVDYAAAAITALAFSQHRRHSVYHVSAGPDASTSAHALACGLAKHFDSLPPFRFVPSASLHELRRWILHPNAASSPFPAEYLDAWRRQFGDARTAIPLLSALRPYFAFMELDQSFDNSRLLADTELAPPEPAHTYMERCMGHIAALDVLHESADP